MTSFSVSGIREIKAKLAALTGKLEKQVVAASTRQAIERTRDRARSYAPVDTGATRDSINVGVEVSAPGLYLITIVCETPYARYPEYGTTYIDAWLFMARAYEETADDGVRVVEADIIAGIEALLSE